MAKHTGKHGRRKGEKRERPISFLLLEPDHVTDALAPVIKGQSVEVKICLGEKKASPQTIELLEEEADRIGAVVKDGYRDPSCWRLIEPALPPEGTLVAATTA